MTRNTSRLAARLVVVCLGVISGIGIVGSSAQAVGSDAATSEAPLDPGSFPMDDENGPDEELVPDPETLPEDQETFWADCGGSEDVVFRTWKNVGSGPVVTHASRFENDGDTPLESTETVEIQTVITAGAEFTVGVTATAKALVGELEEEASLKIQASGSYTTKTSISTKVLIPPHKTYVYFKGTVKVAGKFTEYECRNDRINIKGKGTARSFTVNTTGQLDCAKTPRKALAKAAKRDYCD